jgi:predicted DNA-binding transcriptional regulator AlpA
MLASADDCYLTAAQTRTRYGHASAMWLWRRLHDDSGFPPPILINKRRFWRLSELVAWERSRVAATGPQIVPALANKTKQNETRG